MDTIKQILMMQAWERAKGELQSILHTFYGEQAQFDKAEDLISKFIADFEGSFC